MTLGSGLPVGKNNGMEAIRDLVEKNDFINQDKKGLITTCDVFSEYLERIFELVRPEGIKLAAITERKFAESIIIMNHSFEIQKLAAHGVLLLLRLNGGIQIRNNIQHIFHWLLSFHKLIGRLYNIS